MVSSATRTILPSVSREILCIRFGAHEVEHFPSVGSNACVCSATMDKESTLVLGLTVPSDKNGVRVDGLSALSLSNSLGVSIQWH